MMIKKIERKQDTIMKWFRSKQPKWVRMAQPKITILKIDFQAFLILLHFIYEVTEAEFLSVNVQNKLAETYPLKRAALVTTKKCYITFRSCTLFLSLQLLLICIKVNSFNKQFFYVR